MSVLLGGNFLTVVSLMTLGCWLESINGRRGFIDELLTPFPLGLCGAIFALARELLQ
ncbi:MAG: hypothetical protein ACREC9_12485 [Methylocella sp.]